ncbi:hypothetical protein T484DRAFT_1856120 [Baffinella frigidus]|nr:hypothetical protein T484DRAFT_1856120 [Cryptophyta sp. CCMP2293]
MSEGNKYLELDVDGITYEPKGDVKLKGAKVSATDYSALNELCKVASLCNQSGLFKNAQVHPNPNPP